MQFPIRSLRTVGILAAAGIVVSACSATTAGSSDTTTVSTTVNASDTSAARPSSSSAGSAGPASPVSSSSSSSPTAAPSSASDTKAPPAAPSSQTFSTSAAPTTPAGPVVKAAPAFGSDNLTPRGPIMINVDGGTIASLQFSNPAGAAVQGVLSKDKRTWTLAEPLGYDKTYTVDGTAVAATGARSPISGTFSTLDPARTVRATITPGDDAVVGVAAPVIVSFAVEPADRAAIAKAVTITTTPKVAGAWVWIQHDDQRWALDFRPAKYWPAGTKVHVQADMYGLKFADRAYGAADLTSDFTIGRNQVVKADVNSHYLRVFRDGKEVSTYPASFGKGDTPDTITRSGIHVVNEKFDEKLMSNPKYGYTNLLERWAVRLSDNGEFIHANPSTLDDQGKTNVSHGCVNLSSDDAKAYFDTAIYGDPVEITGTTMDLGPSDGDIFDWSYSWSEWKNLEAATN